VAERLRARWPTLVFDLIPMVTEGDEQRKKFPDESPDFKRAFTRRLEEALFAGRIDAAVHSLKDMPATFPQGLVLGAVPLREVPFDALVSRDGRPFAELPERARVGTSSLRRIAQLRAARPEVHTVALDGNVDTRLRKLDASNYDAVVLAAAGLRRLGLAQRITELFPPEVMVPAIGQGALAVEILSNDSFARDVVATVNDPASRAEAEAELTVARALGVGCNLPAGALGRANGAGLRLTALLATPDGRRVIRASATGSAADPEAVGRAAVSELLQKGAREILGEAVAG
jgi:hydroxymethylbilane synthase